MKQELVSCFTKGLTAKILTKLSFLIPGLGLAAVYCMKQTVNAISSVGDAVKVVRLKCERIQCPNCYQWWISQRVFALAVKIEAYAKVTGERPASLVVSVHPDSVKGWSWSDYGNFFRTGYNRLAKLGLLGGIRVFHPFRIPFVIQSKLRELGYHGFKNGGKGGFWAGIRDNALNLKSWYQYVELAPHMHIIGYPSFIGANTKKDIVIKKYAVLGNVRDTVGHIRYLLSHCGILTKGENEPALEFGCLHGFHPEKFLSEKELLDIKNQVAEAMGLSYNAISDSVEVAHEEEEDKYGWIPLYEFADYSQEQQQFIAAFITSISDHDNRMFVNNLIDLYNERRQNTGLERHQRHVFLEDLVNVPIGFEIVEFE
jgi:hypothetical protein